MCYDIGIMTTAYIFENAKVVKMLVPKFFKTSFPHHFHLSSFFFHLKFSYNLGTREKR